MLCGRSPTESSMMAKTAEDQCQINMKLLVVGNSAVGKTSLMLRYANESFSPVFISTIGVDFKLKHIEVDNQKVRLQIWDTAGQERYRTITSTYFRGASGILLVYDVTDRRSFESIRHWAAQAHEHCDANVNKVLIGNKCDMKEGRVVSAIEGQNLAEQLKIKFFEASAKSGMNVDVAFLGIARDIKNRILGTPAVEVKRKPATGIKLQEQPLPVSGAGAMASNCC